MFLEVGGVREVGVWGYVIVGGVPFVGCVFVPDNKGGVENACVDLSVGFG